MIKRVIKMLEVKFCRTLVKRIICVILLAFEVDKKIIVEKLCISKICKDEIGPLAADV